MEVSPLAPHRVRFAPQNRLFESADCTGSTVNNLNKELIENVFIFGPSLPEQRLIGSFFRSLDDLVETQEAHVKKLRAGKCALLSLLFPVGEEGTPRLRFPGFTEEWQECKISELLVERNEQAPFNNEYPLSSFVANKGVVAKTDRYDRSGLTKDLENKPYKRTELGDFVYSSSNLEAGSIGLNRYGKASISPLYDIYSPTKSCIPDFLGIELTRPDFVKQMKKLRQGIMQERLALQKSDFLEMPVLIPSLPEQRLIGSLFRTLDSLIGSEESYLRILKGAKKALLSGMFI